MVPKVLETRDKAAVVRCFEVTLGEIVDLLPPIGLLSQHRKLGANHGIRRRNVNQHALTLVEDNSRVHNLILRTFIDLGHDQRR